MKKYVDMLKLSHNRKFVKGLVQNLIKGARTMFFNEIIHGTQYYRTPTPLPSEWAGDIEKFEEYKKKNFLR